MIDSDDVAIVPVAPLATMFAVTLPGAIAANSPCIMFDTALIGPQLVSPSTRSPTSISGSDSTIAASVIHTGMSSSVRCTMHSRTADIATPVAMNDSGISLDPIRAFLRLRNVSISRRQRSASDVSPPVTSMPVAGHITQNSTSVRVGVSVATIAWPVASAALFTWWIGTWYFTRKYGITTHANVAPISMPTSMRNPTIMPEPTLSKLYDTPTAMFASTTPCTTWVTAPSGPVAATTRSNIVHGAANPSGMFGTTPASGPSTLRRCGTSWASSRNSINRPDSAMPHITALNARSALRLTSAVAWRGGSSTSTVSAAAV